MSKFDKYLNEIVYEIDSIVYDFYTISNEVIINKRNQERLLSFRDKTIETLNEMNMKSLEILSKLSSQELVEERANLLIERNEAIVKSSLEVIAAAPNRSELIGDVATLTATLYSSAKEGFTKVSESEFTRKTKEGFEKVVNDPKLQETIDTVKEKTIKGFETTKENVDKVVNDPKVQETLQKAKEGIEKVVNDPRIKETVDTVKTKSKDAFNESKIKVSDWVSEVKDKFDTDDTLHQDDIDAKENFSLDEEEKI